MLLENIREVFTAENDSNDQGSLVETVIITAGLAVAGILIVSWLASALTNKGADIAGCIEGANTFEGGQKATDNCKSQNHAKDNSFKDDLGYKDRFGLK